MRRAFQSAVLGALLALPAVQAIAIGFGRTANLTTLGHPLDFAVALRLEAGEALTPDCVAVEVLAGENRVPPSTLRVSIEAGADAADRMLRVASSQVIEEPVVNLNVTLTCGNRITRRFVAFVDPAQTRIAQAAPAVAIAPAPAPVAASAAGGPSNPDAQAAAPAVARAATRPAAKPKPPPRATALAAGKSARRTAGTRAGTSKSAARSTPKSEAGATAAAAAPAPRVARLKLESVDDEATRERVQFSNGLAEVTAMVAAAASAVQPAASAPADLAAVQARERLQALEDSLLKLKAESQATQAALATLQARLRDAESERYANPLVFSLLLLVVALVAALVYVLRRRSEEGAVAAQWWEHAPAEQAAARGDDPAAGIVRTPDDEPTPVETTASPMMLSQVQAMAQQPSDADAGNAGREMSVEELIDLEQQAEFFVVLGQDEAAIDLLMGHLRSSGGASPLPYLKLLEIYRRRGDREASERMRERFNRRFNAYAPEWQADLQQGRSLADYPQVVARLQALWSAPTQAMQALEASLFRRDDGHSTFDLPAYRELLFLYAVARDLAERDVVPTNVDLLLPLGGEASDAPSMTRLHPTPATAARAEVDVDITRLDPGPSDDDRPSRFHTDFSPTSGSMTLAGEPSATRH